VLARQIGLLCPDLVFVNNADDLRLRERARLICRSS